MNASEFRGIETTFYPGSRKDGEDNIGARSKAYWGRYYRNKKKETMRVIVKKINK